MASLGAELAPQDAATKIDATDAQADASELRFGVPAVSTGLGRSAPRLDLASSMAPVVPASAQGRAL